MWATALALGFTAFYATLWTLFLVGRSTARKRYSRLPTSDPPPPPLDPSLAPAVSILRPLRGLDCNLYENLEASFLQDYPNFEIVFSVADESDAAIPLVKDLQAKYPQVDSRLIVGEEIVGVNPKINNLIRPYRAAKHDLLWILDSNVLTSPQCLSRSVPLFNPAPDAPPNARKIGLVHHLPFAIYPDTLLGSRVEQVYLCSTHAKMYLAINRAQVASCVTGKSCLYRKSDLVRASELKRQRGRLPLPPPGVTDEPGLAAFGQYLGEDNEIGVAIWEELGMRHAMGTEVAGNAVGSMSFQKYFRRRVRWIRVRKYMVLASTLLEPFTESLLAGVLGALSFSHLVSLPAYVFLPLHFAAWFLLDVSLYTSVLPASPALSTVSRPPAHDGPSFSYLAAWSAREALALPIWLFAMLGDTVSWRDDGTVYRVQRDGSVRALAHGEREAAVERAWAAVVRRWEGARGKGYVTLSPDDVEAGAAAHAEPR
ncbi:ceramide glucosyltransferase [Rhodotorula paludigena]|uniref:ceramide glucosyltransferase n=1 Tax=Rhodotorula paludigena TaxID=86838 RepID=UPI003177FC0A